MSKKFTRLLSILLSLNLTFGTGTFAAFAAEAEDVSTDCPGIQLYAGNFLDETGKGGVHYGKRSGVALETQFYPDSLHHPGWPQPITRAGETYRSETVYRFSWDS